MVQDARTPAMITLFRHKGLRKYFETGSFAGIQAAYANRLKMQLAALDRSSYRGYGHSRLSASPAKGKWSRALVNMGKWQLARHI
jgi:plasmid maintenance system killer protein